VDRIECLPFLSKVGQPLRVGDRTSIDGSMVTVAGLCRIRTGFAAAQRVVERRTGRSVALVPNAANRRSRAAGAVRLSSAGDDRPLASQALAATSTGVKIETWASSGSMTPRIFWSVMRWTHVFQLSK